MWKLVLFVALLCSGSEGIRISCKNEDNVEVDWYILYKPPDGLRYYYIDPTANGMNENPINDKNGVLANTLAQYFDKKSGVGFIAYNDGKKSNQNLGHSKGFVMMDKTSGIWLLHSTPNFPDCRMKDDFFPDSGEKYGQTFICVTFPDHQFEGIGEHLQYIKAPIFKHHISDAFPESLRQAANGKSLDPHTAKTLSFDLKSEKDVEFKSFVSKTSTDGKDGDLYVTIADNIGSDVDVQTWGGQRNSKQYGNYVTHHEHKVHNVKCITIDNRSWGPTVDHSKWCVSKSKDWTCIADSNRAKTQYERPGGALCIKDKRVTNLFKSFIEDESKCPSKAGSKRSGAAAGLADRTSDTEST